MNRWTAGYMLVPPPHLSALTAGRITITNLFRTATAGEPSRSLGTCKEKKVIFGNPKTLRFAGMYTMQQYEALCSAIALGSKTVMYADKRVEYRSLDEMLAIKKLMEQDLGIGSGDPNFKGYRRVAIFDKGT